MATVPPRSECWMSLSLMMRLSITSLIGRLLSFSGCRLATIGGAATLIELAVLYCDVKREIADDANARRRRTISHDVLVTRTIVRIVVAKFQAADDDVVLVGDDDRQANLLRLPNVTLLGSSAPPASAIGRGAPPWDLSLQRSIRPQCRETSRRFRS